MKKIKRIIPNLLTVLRLIASPLIIYLGINNDYISLIMVASILALTDLIDGKLARIWQVESNLGAMLDTIGDKCLAISLLIILVVKNHLFFYVLLLELIIALFNLYVFYKQKIVESLFIGKLKTWIIFITIILGLLNIFFEPLKILVSIFIVITIGLQFISLFNYIEAYNKRKSKKKKLTLENLEYYLIVKEIMENEEFLKRKNYIHHYNESVYDHVLRVSYSCYKIGKKLHLDYKSLAIAGLLHDFYDKPWQDNYQKTKFFQKHGFVHAEQARRNAIKYFPNLVTEKIESMIKTHMFPLNILLPQYKESWLLTIVDKVLSLDFLLHPVLLTRFRKNISASGRQKKVVFFANK